ncbi:hypothetical protein B5M43_014695 [Microbacterium sp. MEC084]|uniref:hypothetical protein n=1 Tax=Microbacterium sp. MEC084 TaxID=1963027 RepID=UPI0010704871|nr:hypothetical protein [Microbacterium sp. MEC084]MCD1270055.1 hypothetical protein [Microbacterium sp. MEC084]
MMTSSQRHPQAPQIRCHLFVQQTRSALERFAASDQLDTAAALAELTSIRVPNYQTGWVIALWTFLEVETDVEPLGPVSMASAASEGW